MRRAKMCPPPQFFLTGTPMMFSKDILDLDVLINFIYQAIRNMIILIVIINVFPANIAIRQ